MIYVAVCFGVAILLLAVLVAVLWSQNDDLFDRFSEMEKAVIRMNDKLEKLLNLDIRTLNATNGAVYRSRNAIVETRNPYDMTPVFVKGIKELVEEQNRMMYKTSVSYSLDNRIDGLESRIDMLEKAKKEEPENAAE